MAFPTNPIYKLIKSVYTNEITGVMKQTDNLLSSIPFDSGNIDYQEYLEWKAIDGNEPEAAD